MQAFHYNDQELIEEYRKACECVVNTDVDNWYIMCNDLLHYDLMNHAVAEDQANLYSNLAGVMGYVVGRYNKD
eukprot:12916506-Prorocentrum_lima.AAC.1